MDFNPQDRPKEICDFHKGVGTSWRERQPQTTGTMPPLMALDSRRRRVALAATAESPLPSPYPYGGRRPKKSVKWRPSSISSWPRQFASISSSNRNHEHLSSSRRPPCRSRPALQHLAPDRNLDFRSGQDREGLLPRQRPHDGKDLQAGRRYRQRPWCPHRFRRDYSVQARTRRF